MIYGDPSQPAEPARSSVPCEFITDEDFRREFPEEAAGTTTVPEPRPVIQHNEYENCLQKLEAIENYFEQLLRPLGHANSAI